jgi:hypothetical protein
MPAVWTPTAPQSVAVSTAGGGHAIEVVVQSVPLQDAQSYTHPFVTISLVDSSGVLLGSRQDTKSARAQVGGPSNVLLGCLTPVLVRSVG